MILRAAIPHDAGLERLAEAFERAPLAQLFLFVSPLADFDRVVAEAGHLFPDATVAACTTAGEIGPEGYAEGTIIAVGLPSRHFATETVLARLDALDDPTLPDRLVQSRIALVERVPSLPTTFAFSMVDGLSRREDALLARLTPGLGHMPLFGGSAGDGRAFGRCRLALDGEVMENVAILTLVATDARVHVFSLDHMTPTATRMVVTDADPETRTVREINAAPAAREYARIVGRDPDQLDTFTFAAHPVVVRLGEDHHVRAIQRVTPEGELVFFSAIDEGMVLSVATAERLSEHLERELSALGAGTPPSDILACDCILRRIEAEESQDGGAVSRILARHRVVGFSTYGEQIGPIHINHTMTGVALYPPPAPSRRK